jgi:putative transposase
MKRNKFTEAQIIKILREEESGKTVNDICREQGIHQSTYYNWKKKYGGMQLQEMQRLKQLEEENRRLKQMYAELSLDHKILKDVIEKKL